MKVLLVAFLSSFSIFSPALEIDLLGEAVVDKKNYRLGDIAVLSGSGSKQLNNIEIGLSPRPGSKHLVNRDQIKARLYRLRPDLVKNIIWSGAVLVKVTSIGELLKGEDIGSIADQALTEWSIQQEFIDYQFSLMTKPDDVLLPQNRKIDVEASIGGINNRALSRMPVWVDIKVDGKHYHSYQVWYQFSASRPAYVALHHVPSNVLLKKNMFSLNDIEVTSLSGQASDNLDQLIGKRLSVALSAGDVVMLKNLEEMPLVSKGEVVEVGVSLGGVDITTKAIALKGGHLKEKISVLNPDTNDSYYVTVIGQNKVRVK